ncbi:hypothetical protein OG535_33045 [Kitasatospora sp. NBC_00085]|uniref:hypothetical protein n=1 Tax=unclassified Kitasatospora TaxID=2633591 RepID=UPI0032513782
MPATFEPPVRVPDALTASLAECLGDRGRDWAACLPALAAELLERWSLRPEALVGRSR